MKKARMALVLVIGLAAAAVSAQDEAPAFPPARVEVARAELRQLAPTVDLSGSVISLNDSRIASEVEGVLVEVAPVGQAVEAGDVLARIDPRLLAVAAHRAEAAVARLEADLHFRERELERSEELGRSNNASATRLDETRAARDAARHQLTDARAQLERARGDLERSAIRAPMTGHVVARLASVGEYVAVGEDVVRLVDTRHKEISVAAPIAVARFVAAGAEVDVRSGERTGSHAVRAVVPVGDAVSRMVEIRLIVQENDWLVGTPVIVSLPSAPAVTAIAIPRDALVERGGSPYVFTIDESGAAQQITATVERLVGLWASIAEGIEAGDRVIIRGAERLAPGQAVQVADGSQ